MKTYGVDLFLTFPTHSADYKPSKHTTLKRFNVDSTSRPWINDESTFQRCLSAGKWYSKISTLKTTLLLREAFASPKRFLSCCFLFNIKTETEEFYCFFLFFFFFFFFSLFFRKQGMTFHAIVSYWAWNIKCYFLKKKEEKKWLYIS